jgi:protein-S-isoprenylcysteine O-methyltransferase Ste14
MEHISFYANLISFAAIVLFWMSFAAIFLFRKKPKAAPAKIGIPASFWGIALQGLGFGVVWFVRRSPLFSPLLNEQFGANVVIQILAIFLAAASVWLTISAIAELGKQWSLQARLIEGHKLVNTGVYRIVRHPIYTAMLGMLIATSMAFSHWVGLLAAIIIFMIGTTIRTRIEERLLDDAFGEEFRIWKRSVPALVPFGKF